jgi:Trypsin-like peptidase domain
MKPLRSCLAVLTALVLPAVGFGPRAAADDVDSSELYQKVVKSCAFIVTPLKGGFAMGSGSLIDRDKRLILTNYHVVHDEDTVFVQFPIYLKDGSIMTDKQEYIKRIPAGQAPKGKVLYRDKARDLALIEVARVPAGTPAIPLAKKSVEVGKTVWNIGSPGAVSQVFSITEGKVRAVAPEKMLVGGHGPDSVFEVRCRMVTATNPVNPGDSGGPLYDKRGYQVGVTESGDFKANLVNFFVDISEVRGLLNEKKIQIKELSDEPDPKGATAAKKDAKKDAPSTLTGGTTPEKKNDTAGTAPEKKNGDAAAATPEKKNGDATPAPSAADEKAAGDLLHRAGIFANDPDNQEYYKGRLREVVKKYPGTEAAKEAQKKLDALK